MTLRFPRVGPRASRHVSLGQMRSCRLGMSRGREAREDRFKANEEPWDDILERILVANGLAYRWEDNVLLIAYPEMLGPERHFTGGRIRIDWQPDEDPSHPGTSTKVTVSSAEGSPRRGP
jgi:hypothetical protein